MAQTSHKHDLKPGWGTLNLSEPHIEPEQWFKGDLHLWPGIPFYHFFGAVSHKKLPQTSENRVQLKVFLSRMLSRHTRRASGYKFWIVLPKCWKEILQALKPCCGIAWTSKHCFEATVFIYFIWSCNVLQGEIQTGVRNWEPRAREDLGEPEHYGG